MATATPLGDFLRSRRARLAPPGPGNARRRTPGLKREEVAQAAGISVEWYVKLEQGRGARPSPETIGALARALRLDEVETRHLRLLASPAGRPSFVREEVPPALAALVERMAEPAYLTGQRWDVLAWNAAAAVLIVDFGSVAAADRNILLFMLTDARARTLFGAGWEDEARRMVSLFRAGFDPWAGDPAFEELVARLAEGCRHFASWWAGHEVAAPVSGTKFLSRACGGQVGYDYASFQANDDPRLKLAVYVRLSGQGAE